MTAKGGPFMVDVENNSPFGHSAKIVSWCPDYPNKAHPFPNIERPALITHPKYCAYTS